MSVFSLQRINNVKNGYVLDLSPERKTDGILISSVKYSGGDTHATGRPIVSDPSSLVAMVLNDNMGGNVYRGIFALLATKSRYRTGGSSQTLYGKNCDIGYYPKKANYIDLNYPDEVCAESRFRIVGGKYPSGIVEYSFKRIWNSTTVYIHALAFTWQEVLYLVFDTQNTDMLNLGVEFYANDWVNPEVSDLSASYEDVGGQGTIWVQDHTTGLWAALACTNMNEYQVSSTPVDVTLPLDEQQFSVSHTRACVGMGTSGLDARGQVVYCISIAKTKSGAQNAVVEGVGNWQTALQEAEAWWRDYFSGTSTIWFAPDELKVKGYMALNQLAASRYGNFLTAGCPHWGDNYLRDTGFVIHNLAPCAPSIASDLLGWFSGVTITDKNHYDMDKVAGGNYNNTDNAAVFLLAAGRVWKYTRDTELMSSIKTQLDQALAYVTTNYSDTDKHILALHPHDDLDDYQEEGLINVTLVKYESLIDILWIYALELVAPVFYTLGDLTSYQSCVSIASGLREGLEDYRRVDGGLEYAIKTDDTLYSSVLTARSSIYAAWLLNDNNCLNWLRSYDIVSALGLRGSNIHWAIIPYWHTDSTKAQYDRIWTEHFLIIAFLAAKKGDYRPLRLLLDSFDLGVWSDYVYMDHNISEGYKFKYYSHSYSFSWAMSTIIELLNQLYLIN